MRYPSDHKYMTVETCEKIRRKLISEFLKSWDYMMERIEFHTENPDSELMDEVREEYKKWEERKNE